RDTSARNRRSFRMREENSVDRTRRAFLQTCGIAGLFVAAAQPMRAWAQSGNGRPMKIGIVGSGKLGGAVGSRWVKVGHQALFSSRHPEQLKSLVEPLGPRAQPGTVAEALAFGDGLLVA